MNRLIIMVASILISGLLQGCTNTAEGIKKDAVKDSGDAAKVVQEAQDRADETGRDIGAAVTLTPAIKSAILADASLNASGNSIDVDSTEERVVLSGSVMSEQLRTLAGTIARKVITEKNGKQVVENKLEIRPQP